MSSRFEHHVTADEWSCPHPAVYEDYCIFHADSAAVELDNLKIATDALVSGEPSEFVASESARVLNGRLGPITVDHVHKLDTEPTVIDVRGSLIDGSVAVPNTDFTQILLLSGCEIEGDLILDNSRFGTLFHAREITIRGDLRATAATFTGQCTFAESSIYGRVDFSRAKFQRQVDFTATTFHTHVGGVLNHSNTGGFARATFEADAIFAGCEFEGMAEFRSAVFGSGAQFNQAVFHSEAKFDDTTITRGQFGGIVAHDIVDCARMQVTELFELAGADIQDTLLCRDAQLGGNISFRGARIDRILLDRSTFTGPVRFDNAVISSRFRFEDCRFEKQVSLQASVPPAVDGANATFTSRIRFELEAATEGNIVVDLTNSHLRDGVIHLLESGHVQYDLSHARLGDVKLRSAQPPLDLNPFMFHGVRFDGFDFADSVHRVAFRDHSYEIVTADTETVDPELAEITYNNAKNGAMKIGDNRAASAFFIREKQSLGKTYLPEENRLLTAVNTVLTPVRDSFVCIRSGLVTPAVQEVERATPIKISDALSDLYSMTLYFRNQIHGLVTGYGEKPLRPVIASSTVIGVFSVLYWLLWTISSTPQPEGYGGVYGPLILSAESFTTLVIGGGSVNQSSIQLLAYTEGFLGAFLIALFVFTLTRSVHR
jgi:uncharacterized protein YjbI with pentapeptide repeats